MKPEYQIIDQMTLTPELQDAVLEIANDRLDYNPNTGIFIWKKSFSHRVRIGDIAGTNKEGYRAIRLSGKLVYCHRLAWAFFHGEFPRNCIDHINGVRHDNRIVNLRDVTNQQNIENTRLGIRNPASGVSGVRKLGNVFAARIMVNKKEIHLGCFSSIDSARDVYLTAKRELHKGFAG